MGLGEVVDVASAEEVAGKEGAVCVPETEALIALALTGERSAENRVPLTRESEAETTCGSERELVEVFAVDCSVLGVVLVFVSGSTLVPLLLRKSSLLLEEIPDVIGVDEAKSANPIATASSEGDTAAAAVALESAVSV